MIDLKRWCALPVLMLLLCPLCGADEAVLTRSGSVLLGKVISLDEKQLVIEVREGKQTVRKEVATDTLQPGSLYELKARRLPAKDARAHLALGDWCLTRGVTYFAIREYEKALALDGGLAAARDGLKKARLARGKDFYVRAVAAMKRGRYDAAERLFRVLVEHYATPFGGPARKALEHIKQARLTAKNLREAGQARTESPSAVEGQLGEIARQARLWSQAAYGSRTDSRARRNFVKASQWSDRGLQALDQLRQAGKIDAATHARLRRPFVRFAVDTAIQIAVIYLRQDNEYGANKWLARALALDPDNQRARELRLFVITEWRDEWPWSRLGRRQR